jgi:hypothetical protein
MVTPNDRFPIARRRLRPATVIYSSAAALVLLLFVGVGVGMLISERRVREELAKIRAAGEPITPADLEAFYALPPGSRDTSSLWLSAAEAVTEPGYCADAAGLPLVGDGSNKLPEPDEPWPQQAAAEAFLAKYASVLARLHQAAALGGQARYPTRFSDGATMMLKPQPELRFAALLLTLECEVHARRGDAHSAAASIRALFAMARSFEHEPVLVAQLMRLTKDDAAINRLERLLQTAELSDDDLVALDGDMAVIDYYAHLHRSLLGDRVLGLQHFGNSEALDNAAPPTAAYGIFRQADLAVYLQVMSDHVAASTARNLVSLQAAMDLAQDNTRAVTTAPLADWRYPFSKLAVPSLEACLDAIGRGTARCEAGRAAIAVERFRLANGRLPKTLGELVPGFLPRWPVDPFDGAALRWSVAGDEYRVYSIGVDGIDQGGLAGEQGAGGDLVFRVPLRNEKPDETTDE